MWLLSVTLIRRPKGQIEFFVTWLVLVLEIGRRFLLSLYVDQDLILGQGRDHLAHCVALRLN